MTSESTEHIHRLYFYTYFYDTLETFYPWCSVSEALVDLLSKYTSAPEPARAGDRKIGGFIQTHPACFFCLIVGLEVSHISPTFQRNGGGMQTVREPLMV